jgi:hypothetical protein
MRLCRIRYAFPWRIALVLSLIPGLPILSFWAWFQWELPPLQRYYLVDYWQSSKTADQPDAQTQVQWLLETGPGHKARVLLVYDVGEGRQNGEPLEISSAAVGQGWTGIDKSPTDSVGSAELEDVLRRDFYDGRGFNQVVNDPVLFILMEWFLIIYLAFMTRGAMGAEWRELRRVVPEPQWPSNYERDWPRNPEGIVARIRTRIATRKMEEKLDCESRNFWAEFRQRAIHGQSPNPQPSKGSFEPASTEVRGEVPSASQPANPLTPAVPKPGPVQHKIFPGSTSSEATQSQPQPWDESEWID